jgi:hypothetical protein
MVIMDLEDMELELEDDDDGIGLVEVLQDTDTLTVIGHVISS